MADRHSVTPASASAEVTRHSVATRRESRRRECQSSSLLIPCSLPVGHIYVLPAPLGTNARAREHLLSLGPELTRTRRPAYAYCATHAGFHPIHLLSFRTSRSVYVRTSPTQRAHCEARATWPSSPSPRNKTQAAIFLSRTTVTLTRSTTGVRTRPKLLALRHVFIPRYSATLLPPPKPIGNNCSVRREQRSASNV